MKKRIQQYFEVSTEETALAVELIAGICASRQISATALSTYVSGDIKEASKARKVERFYSKDYVDNSCFLGAIRNIFGQEKFVLSLDRTSWKFGKNYINAFAGFGSRKGRSSLLDLQMLDNKGGNSNNEDRIEMVLGDREFFSVKFAKWLSENEIPYAIRLRENLEFIQPYLKMVRSGSTSFGNIVITGDTGE